MNHESTVNFPFFCLELNAGCSYYSPTSSSFLKTRGMDWNSYSAGYIWKPEINRNSFLKTSYYLFQSTLQTCLCVDRDLRYWPWQFTSKTLLVRLFCCSFPACIKNYRTADLMMSCVFRQTLECTQSLRWERNSIKWSSCFFVSHKLVQFEIVFDKNFGFLFSSAGVTRGLLSGPNPRIDKHRSVVLAQTASYCGNRTRYEEPGTVSVLLIIALGI